MRALIAVVVLAGALAGCPIRVDPPSDRECPRRETCGICASDPNCAWLATPDAARRRCYARRELAPGEGVRVTEDCPEDGPLGERAPASSGS